VFIVYNYIYTQVYKWCLYNNWRSFTSHRKVTSKLQLCYIWVLQWNWSIQLSSHWTFWENEQVQ